MLKKTLLLSVALASILSCKKEEISPKPLSKDTIRQTNTEVQTQKIQDESPIETVKTFFKWYRDHENQLDSFNTVKGGINTETGDTANYYIDFNEVEKEIKLLSNTGFFSPGFLNTYKKRYKDGDEYFRQNPANDGPPVNFDYNYFFLTQEDYESDLKNTDRIKFTIKAVNDQLCYVECHLEHCGMKLKYTLIKKDQWMIDTIQNIS
ncbi:hypothetical protein [Chryseobacterium lactis]|uniref:hypothetical protein n=1 Tax=Chryseobacterium lactis TaxID=1241981 RepID=UPI001628E712|nr:hypothetical protein [Chryseobacterium lactis]